VIVMPAFDDLRTLFYPVAPSLERRLDPVPNVREMPGSARVEWLPAGLQTAEVYSRATRRAEPFTGAVMVIAINDYAKTVQQHGEATVQPILDDVLRFISEVAGAQAFLCRSSDDELVLLWPKERLPEPRQVFHAITEKLWDYQLRTLGGVTVIFGWGFHEAEAGSLLSAVGAAREQMTDNRRNRRTTMTGVGRFRRLMVS
jgi:GGDEF domain-containing protein